MRAATPAKMATNRTRGTRGRKFLVFSETKKMVWMLKNRREREIKGIRRLLLKKARHCLFAPG